MIDLDADEPVECCRWCMGPADQIIEGIGYLCYECAEEHRTEQNQPRADGPAESEGNHGTSRT